MTIQEAIDQLKRQVSRGTYLASCSAIELAIEALESYKSQVMPFVDDYEKIRDLIPLSKQEFLRSYSYLSEEEYDVTIDRLVQILYAKGTYDYDFLR